MTADHAGFHTLHAGDRYRITGNPDVHTYRGKPGVIPAAMVELVERPARYTGATTR